MSNVSQIPLTRDKFPGGTRDFFMQQQQQRGPKSRRYTTTHDDDDGRTALQQLLTVGKRRDDIIYGVQLPVVMLESFRNPLIDRP